MRKTLITAASLLGLMAGCAQPATAQSLDQWLENHRAQERATEAQHKATLASRQIFRLVPAGLQAKAAAYIKDTLKDPDSARFRFDFMSVGNGTQAVCGKVNGRNPGGYVGMQIFYVDFVNGVATDGGVISRVNFDRSLDLCGYVNLEDEWVALQ
jgi:hypothetical protein